MNISRKVPGIKYSYTLRGVFAVLAILASGQVFWWAHLLTSQRAELALFKPSIEESQAATRFKTMIFAEGGFFLVVWLVGMIFAYRAYREQLKLRRAQNDFVSAVTHELKTPIANVRLCLDTLERPDLLESQRQRYIERAQKACDRLLSEVEGVLAISGTEERAGARQRIDLKELVHTCINQFHEDAQRIELKAPSESSFEVVVSLEHTRLVIQSLLDNALKYSSDSKVNPRIQVSLVKGTHWVDLAIQDYGVGLDAEELGRAFDPFWRSERSVEAARAGTGLGLSLAQRLSQAAGIKLTLTSPGRDQGARASLRFQTSQKGSLL